jgi:hypothetical protein
MKKPKINVSEGKGVSFVIDLGMLTNPLVPVAGRFQLVGCPQEKREPKIIIDVSAVFFISIVFLLYNRLNPSKVTLVS